MQRMAFRLNEAGYQVTSVNYPSTFGGIDELTALIAPLVPTDGTVDMVGHSMGGLLAKRLMRLLPANRRGRIVLLGSPNLGSEAASQLAFLSPFLGDALKDLVPSSGNDDSDLEIGAIAGTRPVGVLAVMVDRSVEHDGMVTVESAWAAASPQRRIKIATSHTILPIHSDAVAETIHFLRTGEFSKSATTPSD